MTTTVQQGVLSPDDGRPPVELRDYQLECIAEIVRRARAGERRLLVVLATGGGKTLVFSDLPARAQKKTLIIAHREELLEQARDKLLWANPGLIVDIEQAERRAGPFAAVVVASVQTLASEKRRADFFQRFAPERFSLVVVDEAHHLPSVSYLRVLAALGLVPPLDDLKDTDLERRELRTEVRKRFEEFRPAPTAPLLVGVTATPNRTDGRGLEYVFDDIAYQMDIKAMIEAGWLVPILGQRIRTKTDITGVKTRAGDYAERELSEAVNTEERNSLIVEGYLARARDRQAIAFGVDVQHAHDLAAAFQRAGVAAVSVVGETPKDLRRDAIAKYRAGRVQVLVNCAVALEGFDAPNTSCIITARPTKSSLIFQQMIGRGTRPIASVLEGLESPEERRAAIAASSKPDLLVLDFADTAKVGIATLNTLFGLPPKLDVSEKDTVTSAREMEELGGQLPIDMLQGIETVDEARHLAEDFNPLIAAAQDPVLAQIASMAWVKTPFGYALGLPDLEQIGVVEDALGRGELRFRSGSEKARLGMFDSPAAAVRAGEDWVRGERPQATILTSATAAWRSQEPTSKQLGMAKRLKIRVPPNATRGTLSALIGRRMAEEQADD